MRTVWLSGASGLIGWALTRQFLASGYRVMLLKRPSSKSQAPEGVVVLHWDPQQGVLPGEQMGDPEIVVHLGGANIAEKRWTPARKAVLRDSRIKTAGLISKSLAEMTRKPQVFICASAIGFYGDRGQEVLTEASEPGQGFLADLCAAWEAACEPAKLAGIRTVQARFGMVLDPQGGALSKMKGPFSLGLGGVAGSGKQMMSWISLNDAVRALLYCANEPTLDGPVNLTHPQAVSNREFTKTLAGVLGRPAVMPLPRFAARLAMGEMADSLLFDSCHAVPEKLIEAGFQFEAVSLESTLKSLLS